ncbi:NEDD4-binding protein 2 isoform X2 [Narcine bancroftii]|uniref:NEDD4-binding protein 2 isoform X2 n=1 Tax=Narcine bancroftii TaxID=1343680 RepID=UPI0038310693
MPKKKKNAATSTPARPPGCGPLPSTAEAAVADRAPDPTWASASNSTVTSAGAASSGVKKEELLDRMTEMFSHLDPSVVYVVLSECDFKADDAMDSLLVLSEAAKGVTSCSSGFECVAAALSDQINSDNEVVMEDHGSNSVVASESIGAFGWNEQLECSIENELEKYCINTSYEQSMSFPQYQPFMNRYNSPINQFPRLCVGGQLPPLIQANLNSGLNNMSHQQQRGANDGLPLGHLPYTLNTRDPEENLSFHFNSENNIETRKKIEFQSEYDFSLETIEKHSSKNTSAEHGIAKAAFPKSIKLDGADIWTNQNESHGLSAGISMNIGAIGSKKGDSENFGPKYTLPNTVGHQTEHLQSSDISDKAVGRCLGADGNEMWFGLNRERSSSENYKLFGEPQAFKVTNELLQKNRSLSKKPLENKDVSKNMKQNTTCFPYWFDVGKDSSSEKLAKSMNSEEASYPQYSSSVHFTNNPTMPQVSWNPWAPEFHPMSMAKAFITPVAVCPVKPRPADVSPWKHAGPVTRPDPFHPVTNSSCNSLHSKPHLNPHGLQQLQTSEHPFPPLMNRKTLVMPKVLFLMRGLPGSGKSTLARMLVQQGPNGIILSTDDYFYQNGNYQFNPNFIGEAHQWNQKRAKEAMEKGFTPVIIDNTNTQSWEMKPYIIMAFKHNYKVAFREPNTWWKFKPRELERRNVHGVSKEKIKTILDHYERHVTISTVMASSQPTFPEKKAVELYPTENAESRAINEASGPANFSDHQDSSYTLIPVLTCAEDRSAIKTDLASSDDLESSLRSSANFPSESEKYEIGHKAENSTKYSQFVSRNNVQKADQPAGSNDSNCNFSSLSKTEDRQRKPAMQAAEFEAEAAEATVQWSINDLAHDNLTGFRTSLDQKIGNEKWESTDGTYNVTEGAPKLPVEADTLGESSLTKAELKKQTSNVESKSLNFVGDWPVIETPKPQDQRKRRTRKASERSITNDDHLNQSSNLEPVLPSDSLKRATLNLIEQGNVEVSNESNRSEVSEDYFDDGILSSPAVNSINETSYENGEDHETPQTSEEQISEASSDKHLNKKSWQNKRVGKACKLALTFTSNSPISEEFLEPVPLTTDQVKNTAVIPDNPRQDNSTQTAPEHFAVLWRIENENTSIVHYKILQGTLNGVKSTNLDETPKSINPNQSVPYRVTHDKSTYVDENEFVNCEENLQILSNCFKSIPLEDLNDLYEKCNKDVEWTTNLLLDSGVKLANESPITNQLCLDPNHASSSIAQNKQIPPTEKIDLSEELLDRCKANHFPIALETIRKVSCQSSEMNSENDTVECMQSCLDFVTINPLTDNTKEPELVAEETKSTNNILSNVNLPFNMDCEQFTNSSMEYHGGEEQRESMFKKNLVNNEVMCMKGDVPVTLNRNNTKETNNISNCTDIRETPSVSKPELKTETQSVTETQSNSDVEKISALEENENKVKTINDENTFRDGLGLCSDPMQIQSLELRLPPELAIQLNDLFGSVGLDPGALTPEECVVQIDLNLAKIIHQKWKETILERQNQESLSYQLLLEGGNLSENLTLELAGEMEEEEMHVSSTLNYDDKQPKEKARRKVVPLSASLIAETDLVEGFPFMDHWSAQVPHVSLRNIMMEEMDFQIKQHQFFENSLLSTKDCAIKLKEKQLLEMFPGIAKHFIIDMYKDNNYSFEQTEQFLKSLFDCDLESSKAIEVDDGTHQTELTVSKNKEKLIMTKDIKDFQSERIFQDVEYADYEDYRNDAALHRRKQQDYFSKAAEAHRRGMKAVATHYAQQGHLHGEKMKEANHKAAVKIFKQVNVSLLPQNVLDLHGLHVDEALHCLKEVLFQKINDIRGQTCSPPLSPKEKSGCSGNRRNGRNGKNGNGKSPTSSEMGSSRLESLG